MTSRDGANATINDRSRRLNDRLKQNAFNVVNTNFKRSKNVTKKASGAQCVQQVEPHGQVVEEAADEGNEHDCSHVFLPRHREKGGVVPELFPGVLQTNTTNKNKPFLPKGCRRFVLEEMAEFECFIKTLPSKVQPKRERFHN